MTQRYTEKLQECADILRLAEEADESVPDQLVQQLMTSAVKLYVAKLDDGEFFCPFSSERQITATEVLKAVTQMLHAANVELFELGMWQAWGNKA